jgi:hypothetical protein
MFDHPDSTEPHRIFSDPIPAAQARRIPRVDAAVLWSLAVLHRASVVAADAVLSFITMCVGWN